MTATDSQGPVIAFLSTGEAYGRPQAPVERRETHCSIIFLAGDRAYKLKRAVTLPYLDYGTAAKREKFCRAELALNRRTAPELYLAVHAVTNSPLGGLSIDGQGEAVDWVLEMRRFEDDGLFDNLAAAGRLTAKLMRDLADEIARFHTGAEPSFDYGGSSGVAAVIAENDGSLAGFCPPLDANSVAELHTASLAALARVAPLLDKRRQEGKVRRCHGDLHLRNICLYEGRPTLFDCVEFSDAIACIDVLYDLAFLLMDLNRSGLNGLANAVFNRYLDRTGDVAGLAALPLLMSVRAAIRAHVAATAALRVPDGAMAQLHAEARAYLASSRALLVPGSPRLIAVGGLSGSGKSTLANAAAPAFAPAPGARVISSDVTRKWMMNVRPEVRLPPAAYARAISEKVYSTMRDQAGLALDGGYTAIVDATFIDPWEREAIAGLATHAGVPFTGLWLTGPGELLACRIAQRRGDPSDADRAILLQQLEAGTGPVGWHMIDASGDVAACVAAAQAALRL